MAATIIERQFTTQQTHLRRETSVRPSVTQARPAVDNHNTDSVQVGGEHTCYDQQMEVQSNLKTMMAQIRMSQSATPTNNGNSGVGRFVPKESDRLAQGPGMPTGQATDPVTSTDAASPTPNLTVGEAQVLRDGLLNASKWAPPGDVPSLFSVGTFFNPKNPGKAAYTNMISGQVNFNTYNLSSTGFTKAQKVAFATATWANELYHVRGGYGDKASDQFQNSVLRNWVTGLDAEMGRLGYKPEMGTNTGSKDEKEFFYLYELKTAAINILDERYKGWPCTQREMEGNQSLWKLRQGQEK